MLPSNVVYKRNLINFLGYTSCTISSTKKSYTEFKLFITTPERGIILKNTADRESNKKNSDWMWRHISIPSVDVTSQLLVTLPTSPPGPTVFPNPILYRSFKIAASLIHIGTRRNGMREARRAGEMKEKEKQISGRVAMIHNVKWHSLCMSDSLLS